MGGLKSIGFNKTSRTVTRHTMVPGIYFSSLGGSRSKIYRGPTNPVPDGIWPRFKGYEDRSGRPKQTVLGIVPTQPA
jgi:hypothetical protein